MNRTSASPRGFTLIELAVTVAVIALLVVLAAPNLAAWMYNGRVRTTADLLQDGLRTAQSEAVKQNRVVEFVVTSTLPTPTAIPAAAAAGTAVNYWYAAAVPWTSGSLTSNGVTVSSNTLTLLASGVLSTDASQVTITTNAPTLCFSPYGRLTAVSNDPTTGSPVVCSVPTATTTYQINPVASARAHPLDVTVSMGGQIRMCDTQKQLSAGYPDGC